MSMTRNDRSPLERIEVVHPVTGEVRQRYRQALNFFDDVSFDVSLTKQEFVAESDINNIIKRYRVTGLMKQLPQDPIFGDFTNIPDYQESLNIVIRGQEAFGRLSSDLRTRFDNDPAKFLEFMADPKNEDEIYKLGLARRPKPSDADRVIEAVNGLRPAQQDAEPPQGA